MATKENESMTFHNENALLRIALWAKVVGWVILVIYVLSWLSDVIQTFSSGGFQLPAALMDKFLFLANFVYPVAMGGFYFLILQGLAQGLYIAMDLFAYFEDEEEEVKIES